METSNGTERQGMQGQPQNTKGNSRKERSMGQRFFFAVLVAVIFYGTYTAYRYFVPVQGVSTSTSSDPTRSFFGDTYSGVFLDNNDVYFGKITKRDGSFITLENTFYLRVTQVSQKAKNGKDVTVPSLNLVKLGAELHKPKDKIELQVSHIVSIQELEPTSEVIKVINNYKAPTPDQAPSAQ